MDNKKWLIWNTDVQHRLVDLAIKRGNVAIPLHRITNILFNESQAVDAVEVVHGHWIQDDEYDICSVCNNPVIMNRLSPDKWCKNCGARMDGDKDGK